MPPKPKFTRDEIIDAALGIARSSGIESVKARDVGEELGCSSRPIFTFFAGMEELQQAVTDKAWSMFSDYLKIADDYVPSFKMRGMQMVKFAQNEPKLFQDLFMSGKNPIDFQELMSKCMKNFTTDMKYLQKDYQTDEKQIYSLFNNLWIHTYGICVMCATKYCTFTDEEIASILGQCFAGGMMLIKNNIGNMMNSSPALKGSPEAEKMTGVFPGFNKEGA